MKSKILIIIAALGTIAATTSAFITDKSPADKGFAVVELFTSEGCSSCPPADALIAKLHKETSDKPIYILAYHVDYWDRLGWKDAFSNPAYSDRQKQYARWLKSSELYTPQAIVNGSKQFVGSDESTLRNTIKADLAEPAKTDLVLTGLKAAGNKVTVKYEAKGSTDNSVLMVAFVERNATTKVMKGENAGRTISHVQIVRELQSIKLNGHTDGTTSLAVPSGFTPEGFEMIAFVQNTSNGVISGAAGAEFNVTLSK
ncbi:MAG: DUF1223 domain-containing protein [Bacteroidetes bacterium]|nr:DUF1223 domain-containing protein [Bacteroidota bacterium]